MTEQEKQIEKIVDLLGCSIVEAQSIIESDKKIDKGQEVDFGLSKEEEKRALKLANVTEHKKPTVYKFNKKGKKPDPPKRILLNKLLTF